MIPAIQPQLLLDIIQTIPRSELFALSSRELLDMAMAVVDLGSRRRTLLFLRADQLAHFVSCLVYLPRDRYTTAVRLEMQDILVRELGGESIEYAARVSESPWAVVHFTVRLPDGSRPGDVDVSLENETRIQDLLTEAARTWGDRLLGAVKAGSIDQAKADHYSTAFNEDYKQAITPEDAIKDIAIIEELQDNSVKLVFSDRPTMHAGTAQLTWYLGGRSASLSQLLPMLQCMGVIVLEERPFTVTRPDGLPVWIYQFKISVLSDIPEEPEGPERDATAVRFADAVTAIWHGRAEIDRFNELVLRAGLTWQQVVILRTYAKYLRQAGFPYSQAHIEAVLNGNPGTSRSLVELFEALFDPAGDPDRRAAQAAAASVCRRHRRADQSGHRPGAARLRVDDPGHAAHQLLCQPPGFGPRAERALGQAEPSADRRTSTAAAEVRDLRVLAAGRGRAPAIRVRRPRRAAVVGSTERTSAPRSSVWSRRRR